jgi:hypothetical protein
MPMPMRWGRRVLRMSRISEEEGGPQHRGDQSGGGRLGKRAAWSRAEEEMMMKFRKLAVMATA